jgi:hypothetical protein
MSHEYSPCRRNHRIRHDRPDNVRLGSNEFMPRRYTRSGRGELPSNPTAQGLDLDHERKRDDVDLWLVQSRLGPDLGGDGTRSVLF